MLWFVRCWNESHSVAFALIDSLVLLSLFVSFCVCLLDVTGSVVLLIFFCFFLGFVWLAAVDCGKRTLGFYRL